MSNSQPLERPGRDPLSVDVPDPIGGGCLTSEVSALLANDGLPAALGALNADTEFRFTGVYRFEGDWVVSVALYDRLHPMLTLGENVKMRESYCRIAGELGGPFAIENAPRDPRLDGHAARDDVQSYIAVLLRDAAGRPWGTLCHFDFVPRPTDTAAFARLAAARPVLEAYLTQDCPSAWVMPKEPGPGSPTDRPRE